MFAESLQENIRLDRKCYKGNGSQNCPEQTGRKSYQRNTLFIKKIRDHENTDLANIKKAASYRTQPVRDPPAKEMSMKTGTQDNILTTIAVITMLLLLTWHIICQGKIQGKIQAHTYVARHASPKSLIETSGHGTKSCKRHTLEPTNR